MFEAAIQGLLLVVQWPAIGYMCLGVILGMFFGAVPGLSGLTGMAILLPFTYGMDAPSAFAFLLGMYAVTTTSDTLTAVLLGVPGTASAQATILDGYPLAQRGEAARALGAAYSWSMVGGVLGAVFLALSIPLVKPLILSFAEPEFFMLAVLGLTMVGSLSGGSVYKGIASACFGALLAMIGYAPFGGTMRYTFDSTNVFDGLPLVTVVLGLFSLPEMIDLASRGSTISRVADTGTGMLDGVKDAIRHWWLGLRSTAIGVYIGVLPGLGGSVVDWIAYGHAVQTEKDTSQFGKGDIRGVIAPEAANNSHKGGGLLPTIAFAIPGSASMAILLGAFQIQGLTPGPEMLTTRLDITFTMVWTLAIANVLGAGLLFFWGKQVAKITFVQGHFLIPAILLFMFMGAWMSSASLGDWISLLAFGLIGWVMKLAGWSRPPLVLGFILGAIMENGLHIGVQAHGWGFLTRPVMLVLLALVVITVFAVWRRYARARDAGTPLQTASDAMDDNPRIALVVDLILLGVFIYAAALALDWLPQARLFPLVAALPAVPLVLVAIAQDWRRVAEQSAADAPAPDKLRTMEQRRGMVFYLWMVSVLGVMLVIGQYLALLAFVVLYLRIWGKAGWGLIAIYTGASAAVLYFIFNVVVPVLWYQGPFFSVLG